MFLFQSRKKDYFYLNFQFKMKKRNIFLQNHRYDNKKVEIYGLKLINIIYFGKI